MTCTVRAARADDKTRCMTLLNALSEATGGSMHRRAGDIFDQLLKGARGALFVAEEDGALLGLASVSFNLAMRYGGEYCQLEELVVDPAARGKNVGALLVEETLRQARARDCGEYGLYLVAATEHNRGFYEKSGFVAVGTEMRQPLRNTD